MVLLSVSLVGTLQGCVATSPDGATSPTAGPPPSSQADTTEHVSNPAPPAAAPSSPADQAGYSPPPVRQGPHGGVSSAGVAVNRLMGELARRMREGHQLLSWCAENGRTGNPAASCLGLTATAAKVSAYLSTSPGRLKVEELQGALKRLAAQMGAVNALADAAAVEARRSNEDDGQAALMHYVHQLPAGFAQHAVPAAIPWHGSGSAVLTVGNVPPGEVKVVPRLTARLTVLDGDAIQVTRQPAQSQRQVTDGPLKWVWTLEGVHAGRAEVRMELFVEPSVDGLTPIHYGTWEDDVIVQSSALGDIQEAMLGAGDWLFGGVAQSLRTLLIMAAAASLLLTALWMWRRPDELRALFLRERRGE
jgi:hypothetical protein